MHFSWVLDHAILWSVLYSLWRNTSLAGVLMLCHFVSYWPSTISSVRRMLPTDLVFPKMPQNHQKHTFLPARNKKTAKLNYIPLICWKLKLSLGTSPYLDDHEEEWDHTSGNDLLPSERHLVTTSSFLEAPEVGSGIYLEFMEGEGRKGSVTAGW